MSKYIFIPYYAVDSEVFEADTQHDMKSKWLTLARQSTAKCCLLLIDEDAPNGLRHIYSVSDGEWYDDANCMIALLGK